MVRFIKKYQEKVGLPPGTLVHVGHERSDEPEISVLVYNEQTLEERKVKTGDLDSCFPIGDSTDVVWINIDGVHRTDVIEFVGKKLAVHPLVLADIVNTRQRPKVEDHENLLFIVLKMIYYSETASETISEQVSMIVGRNFVISFQERKEDLFDPVRKRIRTSSGRIRKMGSDYLAYALMDTIVDNYFVILERIGENIEEIEDELLQNPTQDTLQSIHHQKREMITLRRSVWPLREVIGTLERADIKLLQDLNRIYFRDIYDHTIQVIDTIETSRDMLSGMLEIYLSSVSNRMNTVMKVLTIIATIFMPLTFIAGVYGMNFANMPELEWNYGYPLVLLVMAGIGFTMLIYFKHRKWI